MALVSVIHNLSGSGVTPHTLVTPRGTEQTYCRNKQVIVARRSRLLRDVPQQVKIKKQKKLKIWQLRK